MHVSESSSVDSDSDDEIYVPTKYAKNEARNLQRRESLTREPGLKRSGGEREEEEEEDEDEDEEEEEEEYEEEYEEDEEEGYEE